MKYHFENEETTFEVKYTCIVLPIDICKDLEKIYIVYILENYNIRQT